ncbi:hypothetical protein [Kribbia dieselivorans]|uniref:hypothetical protein n=1 Tax=Kribbia dieselivorans TaxID=331526 RepID=UPI000837C8E9|nr:hypothetical protein [Kribbia dieselivorans]
MGGRGALLDAALGDDAGRYVNRIGADWDEVREWADHVQSADAEAVLRGEIPRSIADPTVQTPVDVRGTELLGVTLLPPLVLAAVIAAVLDLALPRWAFGTRLDAWELALAFVGALVLAFLVWFPWGSRLTWSHARTRDRRLHDRSALAVKRRVWQFREAALAQMRVGEVPGAYVDAIGASGIDVRELR